MIMLGGIEFHGFELPERLGLGGTQNVVTHKVLGGKRVLDAMGPDDEPISWSGRFLGETAQLRVFQLDLLRRSGREVQLTFALRSYRVVVSRFTADLERPYLYSYSITCEVVEDQVAGDGGAESRSLEAEVAADIAMAERYAAGRDLTLLAIGLARNAVQAAMGNRQVLHGLGSLALASAQEAIGEAVAQATGDALAANAAVAAVGGIGGVIAGGDPAVMAANLVATAGASLVANQAGLSASYMGQAGSGLAAAQL